jgi:DNA-binding SARP family transcriptional activator
MMIRIQTLGGLRVVCDGVELDRLPAQRLRAALLVHIAIEGRVSRESLLALFWPESTGTNARHALRQSLYHLRRELGPGWVESLSHHLAVGRDVVTDAADFAAALEAGDAERAARCFGGPFLDGVHLADLNGWESWVDARRAHYARLFRRACREWVATRRDAGDRNGAVAAAQHWVRLDPDDDEAQHALVSALADAGLRSDAIRQYQVYARHLEAEGLQPLEETRHLMERLLQVTGAPGATAGAPAMPPSAPPSSAATGVVDPDIFTSDGAGSDATDPDATDPDAPTPATHAAPAPQPSRARYPGLRGSRRKLALAAGMTLLVAAGAWGLKEREQAAASSAGLLPAVAVLPFEVRGGDGPFTSDAVSTLLGTALDGATLRTVDPRAVRSVRAPGGRRSADGAGREVAVRLGASMYVLGDVVHMGGTMHVDAAVYDVDTARPLSRASAAGPADSMFAVVDRLAAGLLAGLSPGSSGLTRAASSTTSLAAFKALLEGDAELRNGRFERAEDAYTRAVELDSSFAVAHYRLALARDWAASLTSPADAARAAAAHADRLSPRERSLLAALLAYLEGDAPRAESHYRAIVSRYPEEVEAWMQLGEVLFHMMPRRGRSILDSEEAWRRVLAVEPRNEWALLHLSRVAAADGRAATIDSLLAPFTRVEIRSDRRLVQMRLLSAIGARDSVTVRDLVTAVRSWEDAAAWQILAYAAAFSSDAAMAGAALSWFVSPGLSSSLRADLGRVEAVLHAAGGRLTASAEALEAANQVHGRSTLPALLHEWWYATLPLPHSRPTLEAALHSARYARIVESPPGPQQVWSSLADEAYSSPERVAAVRAFVAGQLALQLRQPALADSMVATLDRLGADGDGLIAGFAVELRARILRERGETASALRLLESLEPDRASGGAANVVPFISLAGTRYLRGELLAAEVRNEEALGWFSTLGALSVPEAAYRPLGHLRQAELYARMGNRAAAAEHYRRFVELWKDGDPAVQPHVAAARRAMHSLTAR